jgi:hypothetical protein
MSVFGNTYHQGSPGFGGWRELDVLDMVLDQDPRATPFFEMTGLTEASDTRHHWQARGVKARAVNKETEGFTFAGQEISIPGRYGNTCQIQGTPIELTRTSRKVSHYGVSDLWQDQVNLRLFEHRGDTEYALLRGNETSGGTGAAREMNGLINAILDYAPAANTTGIGGTTLLENYFIGALERLYSQTDMPSMDVLVSPRVKKQIDLFSGSGAIRNFDITVREVTLNIARYFSSFGVAEIHISRDLVNTSTAGEALFFMRDQMKKAYLDRTHLQPVAKTKDSDTVVAIDELTLEFGNPNVGYYMSGIWANT